MNRWLIVPLLFFLLLGCAPQSTPVPASPTLLPAPSPVPTTPTFTPSPPSPLADADAYVPVARYMLISRPGYSIEILGSTWQYVTDSWGDRHGMIRYKDPETNRELTQAFVILESGETRDDLFGPYPEGSTPLEIASDFDEIGAFTVMALEQEDGALFIAELQTDRYLYGVQITTPGESALSLQELYTQQAEKTVNYLVHDSLQKSRVIALSSPTPLVSDRQATYDSLAPMLISEKDINALYSMVGGVWEYQYDIVDVSNICRSFEDRTPADVLWVDFRNCIFKVKVGASMEQVIEYFFQPGDIRLVSKYATDRYFVFSYQSGHIYYVAILYKDDLAFMVEVESRTLVGMTAENGFTEDTDDFLHNVIMENTDKNE